MKQEIEKEAKEFVNRTTIYGDKKAIIGSCARSYFETEKRCFIAGVNSKVERIKINYAIGILHEILEEIPVGSKKSKIISNKFNELQNQLTDGK